MLRTEIPAGVSVNAVRWIIRPCIEKDWLYKPVVQTSQIGYHPNQPKIAVIELDDRDTDIQIPVLYKITANGKEEVRKEVAENWGKFLRYNYLRFDFSDIKEEGLYQVCYGNSESAVFRIAYDVYDRGVWQPTLEYFLPVQMCHMWINDKYRVWHDLCHMDDAIMAPVDINHIDGYVQGPSTLTTYKPGDRVPGLNIGGWHDAGDYDLRIESQAGETYILAMAQENFNIDYYDETTVDQLNRITEIHQPDGKPDILQQIENGALTIVAGYQALGRLYRGILCPTVRQYVHLGDASAHTDNCPGNHDDRWVFTEDNPFRELTTAAQLAATSRVLGSFNDTLSHHCLEIARELFRITRVEHEWIKSAKIHAAVELFLTTREKEYKDYVLSEQRYIIDNIDRTGWYIGRFDKAVRDKKLSRALRQALVSVRDNYRMLAQRTPYGVPENRGNTTSGSWDVQTLGYYYCFLQEAYPDIFEPDYILMP
ncbi:MAG: glycoside hydrolase family 9 protein [Tannerellaceae bacterium]|nr:glycoside hydrolase family 9 protein [Tannerellaceae bacterium]